AWRVPSFFRPTALCLAGTRVRSRRIDVRLSPRLAAIAVGAGIVDTVGNVCFAASSQHGLVSLTAVLASLYPIVTVLLAASLLHERVAPLQRTGIALT